MKAKRKKLSPGEVRIATSWSESKLEDFLGRAEKCLSDADFDRRRRARECKACFYLTGRIGGAAVTQRQCGVCDNTVTSGNTCVNVVCNDCADRLSLCARCGADRELQDRRSKKWDFVATETLADNRDAVE